MKLGLRKAANAAKAEQKEEDDDKDVKGKAKPKPKGKKRDAAPIDTVECFSDVVVQAKTLSEHATDHGSDLRIVVDEDIVRLKITGSSVKVSGATIASYVVCFPAIANAFRKSLLIIIHPRLPSLTFPYHHSPSLTITNLCSHLYRH